MREGWIPIQLRYEVDVDKFFARLHVIFRNEEADFYLMKSSLAKYGRKVSVQDDLPAHVREVAAGVFELSMLDSLARPLQILCYVNLALARSREPVPIPKKVRKKPAKKVPPAKTDKQKRVRKRKFSRGLRVGSI